MPSTTHLPIKVHTQAYRCIHTTQLHPQQLGHKTTEWVSIKLHLIWFKLAFPAANRLIDLPSAEKDAKRIFQPRKCVIQSSIIISIKIVSCFRRQPSSFDQSNLLRRNKFNRDDLDEKLFVFFETKILYLDLWNVTHLFGNNVIVIKVAFKRALLRVS